jgi:hypothetical protein
MKVTSISLSLAAVLSTVAFLAACSGKPTQIPFLDRVMTTDEFTAQPDVREKVLQFCGQNPGQIGADPNCINAQQSSRMTTAGSGNFPSLDTSVPPDSKGAQGSKK